MSDPAKNSSTGYLLEAVFFPLQHCEVVDPSAPNASLTSKDESHIGWDWTCLDRPTRFEVVVAFDQEPTLERPEPLHVKVVAQFRITGEPTSVQTEEFALRNATALLIPYARQAVTQLTANGPFGARLLQPINVAAVTALFDPMKATAVTSRAGA